jgi:hypothetical protein
VLDEELMRKRTAQERGRTKFKTEPELAAKLNEYRHVERMEKHLFRKKKGQLDEQALIEIEHSVQDSPNTINPCKDHVRMNQTLLPTVLLFISDPNNVPQLCRALLDSGAQETLITESCIQKLELRRDHAKLPITGLNMFKADTPRGKTALNILSRMENNVVYKSVHTL